MPSLQALAELPTDHPCLWGSVETAPEATWVIEPLACLLPNRRTGDVSHWWYSRKQGGVNRHGQPIEALTDQRGNRTIYRLKADDELIPEINSTRTPKRTVLYGGTLFDHFGHLVLDLTRTYQLLRLFRRSKEPIWFHYPIKTSPVPNSHPANVGPRYERSGRVTNPLVLEWLECMGIRKRARLITRKLPASMLVSSTVLYRDRQFVTSDFPQAAQSALAPQLRRRLLNLERTPGRIAYLSRHRLRGGTTRFVGEEQVVRAIADHPRIDVICPEELSIEEKLALFRRYELIAGFPQACMNLKCFAPYDQVHELARQVMFIAGPKSLSSNWINLDRACGFGDRVLDTSPTDTPERKDQKAADASTFQRSNCFDSNLVVEALHELAR